MDVARIRSLGGTHLGVALVLAGCSGSAPAGGTATARAPGEAHGSLSPPAIQSVVRSAFGRFVQCYESVLVVVHTLSARVELKFTILRDGSVADAQAEANLPDEAARACAVRVVSSLRFPRPEGGVVTVRYPVQLAPGDGGAKGLSDVSTP